MLPGPLQVGDLLSGRYRLLDPVASEGPAMLWRAQDEVLARAVAVRVLPAGSHALKAAAQPFLDAAARAARVTHPGLVRVYDALLDERRGRLPDLAYLVREWVEGEPLGEHLLRVGQLDPAEAAELLHQLTDAVTAAHAGQLVHGRIHPGNVLVSTNGRLRLCDAAVAAAALGGSVPHGADHDAVAADTRDLGAVLYALLTATWPTGPTPQPAGGLPGAPSLHGHVVAAHQVRAGVPRALDNAVSRALDPEQVPTLPPLRTPAALAGAADHAVNTLREARLQEATPRAPGWARRHWTVLAAVGVVGVCALAGWFAGLAVGALPRKPNAVDAIVQPRPSASPGASLPAAPVDLSDVVLRDFDPFGDEQENPDQLRNAVDGDPDTAWLTARYRSAGFGGLKPGVGLLVDLGRHRAIHQVQVGFTARGAKVELRESSRAPASLADTRILARSEKGEQLTSLPVRAGTTARYLLVWITELPADGQGWRVGVAELRLT